MKNHKHHGHTRTDSPKLEPIRFEFTTEAAPTSVCIAGTFNDWHAEAKPMHDMGGGRWQKETALPPGTYEYRLVVDGQWMADPLALESVPNPFGGINSVLTVARTPEAAHRADPASQPLVSSNL